jgi:hypothetical protein
MSFPKFISFLFYQSIWFSKLNILQDQFEGMIPKQQKKGSGDIKGGIKRKDLVVRTRFNF